VGARLEGLGTGYWLVPTGAPDPTQPGTSTFGLTTSFDPNIPGGLRNLLIVAIGASGQAGYQTPTQLCIAPRIPDNGHSCDPTKPVPNAVLSLRWDTNFDLDLHVQGPHGANFSPEQPYGGPVDAGAHGIPAGLPQIDRDSLANCIPDGLNQEDLVFYEPPPSGTYTVSVDPFQSCGQPSVQFEFTLYRSTGKCPDCSLAATTSIGGELLASQVNGGVLVPLKIAQVSF
jgi:hypothetical protein